MSISSIIDLAVILIVLVSAGVSFFRGFVREVLTIFGFIGGALAAFFFGSKVAPVFAKWFGVEEGEKAKKLFDLIPYDMAATVCAYAGIFLAVFLILQLISYFMSATIKAIGLGPVDRALGVIFGVARAAILLGIVYAVLGGLIPEDVKKDVLSKSKTVVYLELVADWLKGFMPEDADKAKEQVTEKAQSLKNSGMLQIEQLKDGTTRSLKSGIEDAPAPGYTPQERTKLDSLIENQNGEASPADTALPERPTPNE